MELGDTTFSDLTGTPPQGRALAVVRDFVVFGNTYDAINGNQPQRVQWSGFDDETEWTGGTNQSGAAQLEGEGGDIQFIVGGEYGIIFQEKSIWRMDYEGVPTVFSLNEVEPGRGTPAPGSVVEVGADIYFLSQDGFYVLKDGTVSHPIGESKVDRYFWDGMNESFMANITSAVNPETGHIFWGYPSNQSPSGVVDRLLIYNYKINRWSTATVSLEILLNGTGNNYTLEDMDAFGNLEQIAASFDSPAWQGGAVKLAAFDTTHQLAFFSGETLPATMETGKIYTEGRKTNVQAVRPIIDGNSTVTLLVQQNLPSDTEQVIGPNPIDASGKADFRSNGRYHRIRSTTSGLYNHAVGVEATQVPTDDR
jgi:hypothetical protein